MHEIQHNTVHNLRYLTHEHRAPLVLECCSTALMCSVQCLLYSGMTVAFEDPYSVSVLPKSYPGRAILHW